MSNLSNAYGTHSCTFRDRQVADLGVCSHVASIPTDYTTDLLLQRQVNKPHYSWQSCPCWVPQNTVTLLWGRMTLLFPFFFSFFFFFSCVWKVIVTDCARISQQWQKTDSRLPMTCCDIRELSPSVSEYPFIAFKVNVVCVWVFFFFFFFQL